VAVGYEKAWDWKVSLREELSISHLPFLSSRPVYQSSTSLLFTTNPSVIYLSCPQDLSISHLPPFSSRPVHQFISLTLKACPSVIYLPPLFLRPAHQSSTSLLLRPAHQFISLKFALTTPAGDCDYWVHLRRDPSRRPAGNLLDVLDRRLQAGRGVDFRGHHGQQERVGIRVLEIHHALDHQERLHPAHHDQYESDPPLLL